MKNIRNFRFIHPLVGVLYYCIVTSFFSCGEPVNISDGGNGTNQSGCTWHDSKNAVYYDPYLLLPCSNGCSDQVFENFNLEILLNYWSLYTVMNNCTLGIATDFEFKWTTTFTGESTCADIMPKSQLITLSSENYQNRFSFDNADILEGTPYIPDTFGVDYKSHKHELVFKLKDVENTYDNSIGTVTWTIKWTHPDQPGDEWPFHFPSVGVIGDYKRNDFYAPTRWIYINGQFEEI